MNKFCKSLIQPVLVITCATTLLTGCNDESDSSTITPPPAVEDPAPDPCPPDCIEEPAPEPDPDKVVLYGDGLSHGTNNSFTLQVTDSNGLIADIAVDGDGTVVGVDNIATGFADVRGEKMIDLMSNHYPTKESLMPDEQTGH
ncbi:hypothetical protein [Endozoicomonas elysicola]|uniref:Uncharacterized protein n=1 Tax=Endozoicomonas elysicola TaxID=305900 RepID=A0A081KBH8_9GAMM|nr:hypothetical protein [Endozoicomonas elysicola]KEI71504.1 hypothetical protein GV64_12810 [Endozoicomonas elysicola]